MGGRMKLTRRGVALAGIALVSRLALAQAQTPIPDVTKQVDKVFEKWDKPDSPGCALGCYKDGQSAYKRGYGIANLNDGGPIPPTSPFHVPSIPNTFTPASTTLPPHQTN